MNISINLIKSFTQDKNQGNPTAVVLEGDILSDQQMLSIAQYLGYSETVFVQKSSIADFKIRFFAPNQEVNLCGHGTIACFHLINQLKNKKQIYYNLTQETKAGILSVNCNKDGFIQMEQAQFSRSNFIPYKNDIAALLNISADQILDNYPIVIASTGTPKLLISIKSLDTLLAIKPNIEGIKEYCKLSGAKGFYPFTHQTLDSKSDFHARQFNPLSGVDEDPVTGVAAGALGAYLKYYNLCQKNEFVIEQGHALGKLGQIFVTLKDKVLVGGYAVQFGQKKYVL